MPARPEVRYTYEDYLSIPEDSSQRFEIVDGELFVTPTPRARHQQVVVSITRILATLALEHGLGEVFVGPITVRLHDDTVTEPDVVFLRTETLELIDWNGRIIGAPDLVVEILSPSNRGYDRNLKRRRYQASGVPELWIVDADEDTMEIWRPDSVTPERPRDTLEWRVGEHAFRIALADVFRG
jgi:Uma2 family endonuclease